MQPDEFDLTGSTRYFLCIEPWALKQRPFILRLRDFPARRASRLALQIVVQSSKLLRHFGSQPAAGVRWDEFRNKLRAFLAFEYMDLPLRRIHSLNDLLGAARSLGPHYSPFGTEGIGYHLLKARLKNNADNLPALSALKEIPQPTLVLLHAGFGMALAEFLLEEFAQQASLAQFAELVRRNSLPGFEGITFEALGLVARMLHPELIPVLDLSLASPDESSAFFWHGVGRGAYFAPENLSPFRSAPWAALETCLRETPHKIENALSGLAWALTTINIGQPEIMETFIFHHADRLAGHEEAFVDGVCSAAAIWRQVAPADARLATFSQHEPHIVTRELWERYLQSPFAAASRTHAFAGDGNPQEWFRYRKA